MTLEEAQELIRDLILSGEVHPDYKRVTELSDKLKILITGENADQLLKQVASREDEAQFAQRVMLTNSITPAAAASVMTPFNKVSRNQRIRKSLKLNTPDLIATVEEMKKTFYGGKRKKNKGLEGWLRTRFMQLSFTDPNAWVVMEWDKPDDMTQVVEARPFEVSCYEARNFKVVNGVTHWLFVQQEVTMLKQEGDKVITVPGIRYTLYGQEYSIVWEVVDENYMVATGYQLREGQELVKEGDIMYLTEYYEHQVGFFPGIRVGYKPDLGSNSRTFVNPFHDGMCFFDKSIKTVSEFDLTMTLHAFPQKLQYVDACRGTASKKCNGGLVAGSNETCTVCQGTGYNYHTGSSDVIYRKMPKTKDDMIDLDKTLIYKAPPIDLIQFQNDYTLQLKSEIHQAVFNSQVFVKKTTSTSSGTGGNPTQTATENDNNMQSVYDALEPFTEHYSEVYKDFVIIMGTIVGEAVENIIVEHNFPADFKLKTSDILLSELKQANDSNAPSFLKDSISNDLAEIIFDGDELGLARNKVRRRYFPFNGKDADEIALLMSSNYVPVRAKVLYANFDNIFAELELEVPEFVMMTNLLKQRETLMEKVDELVEELGVNSSAITADALRKALEEGAGNNNPDPNPGNDDANPQNSDVNNPID